MKGHKYTAGEKRTAKRPPYCEHRPCSYCPECDYCPLSQCKEKRQESKPPEFRG